jgi:hypothetical protein
VVFGFAGAWLVYPAMLVAGVPLYSLFRRYGWLGWWQVGIGGSMAGALTMVVLAAAQRDISVSTLVMGLIFSAVGFVSGVFFWLVAVVHSNALTSRLSGRATRAAHRGR